MLLRGRAFLKKASNKGWAAPRCDGDPREEYCSPLKKLEPSLPRLQPSSVVDASLFTFEVLASGLCVLSYSNTHNDTQCFRLKSILHLVDFCVANQADCFHYLFCLHIQTIE